jgi:ion channel-forming bestrophin family protein
MTWLAALMNALTQLVDALTGLERILTTPIPFSYVLMPIRLSLPSFTHHLDHRYSVHLWVVSSIYCFALPFQLLITLDWVTIPATAIAAFIFFGFLVAGEEIENPFGYDKNDLNLDYFTSKIIRAELAALTAQPPPDVSTWAFSPLNDALFPGEGARPSNPRAGTATPEEWVRRGEGKMRAALASRAGSMYGDD